MNSNEMLYISSPSPQEAEQIVEEASSALVVEQSFLDGASAVLTMSICSCTDENSVDNIAHQCRCWLIPPIMYTGGWANYRIFSPSRPDLRRFMDICSRDSEVEVISHHGRENLYLSWIRARFQFICSTASRNASSGSWHPPMRMGCWIYQRRWRIIRWP